ncbi:MAG: hypothetical protein HOL85_09045 [Rhodospirillaceae bacterium]|jgi:hypothetical protein|nr:hypothetical protein [Rhodospirillaceae bacterium]
MNMKLTKTVLVGGLLVVGLSGCMTFGYPPKSEGIGYREARYEEIASMRDYRQCRDDALAIDEKARSSRSAAKYLASARMLEKCEADLGPSGAKLAVEDRMRAYGVAVQNYVKGGDMENARRTLDSFRKAFDGRDLYLANGASFVETMNVLLNERSGLSASRLELANIGSGLRDEVRRVRHWSKH